MWDHLPRAMQQRIIALKLRFFVIDASKVAQDVGLRGRTNTVLQTCFFAISGVLPQDEAISHIKNSIRKTYGRRGEEVVRRNFQAVDDTLARLFEVRLPADATSRFERPPIVPASAPEFVREVTARMMEGLGDEIPVSPMPVDGTFPSGTAAWEKRNIAEQVPVWEPDLCVQCGQCSFVCPALGDPRQILRRGPPRRRAGRIQVGADQRARLPRCALHAAVLGRGLHRLRPVHRGLPGAQPGRSRTRRRSTCATSCRCWTRNGATSTSSKACRSTTARGSISPMCAACSFWSRCSSFPAPAPAAARRPYLKLLSQLFGDRMMVANATGCSSIYGGNLPVTPWSKNQEGRGPAWSNSLFEDNAEFGLGFRLAADKHLELATSLARSLAPKLGAELVEAILTAPQLRESEIRAQRARVADADRAAACAGRRSRGEGPAVGGRSSGPPQHLDRRRRRLGL